METKITIRADAPGVTIDPNIYGQFVEHLGRGVYEGIWVGEHSKIPNVRGIRSDVVAALRKIRVPLVRWPGGCFAELYHWHDGVGPRDQRPRGINAAWNDEPETNAFGTNEFMDFVEQIGAKPFLAVNVTSGSPGEAQAWLQYLTGPEESAAGKLRASHGRRQPYQIPFIGIGNETWGCGGNMTAEYYSDIYRQYLAVLRPYSTLIVADANSDDYAWTEKILQKALFRHAEPTPLAYINRSPQIGMMSIHYYTLAGNDWSNKGAAVGFPEREWALAVERAHKMDEIIAKHSAIIDKVDPERRIGLSINEWGTWWTAPKDAPSNLYQQNTLRDAVIAGLTLNIFQNHAERVRMANVAQMVNVLQSMILTRGSQMIVTPTYHVFDLYQVHQSGSLLPAEVTGPDYTFDNVTLPAISASASRDSKGAIHVSIVNLDPNRAARVVTQVQGARARQATGRILTADSMDARPDFDRPDRVMPVPLQGIRVSDRSIDVTVPAKSVVVLELR
ncbi:alpha-N-arabinofuranosidase [Steroidobacter cummioxidans]|uniref:alpha-N-arabinofuranosidase n=1 Tax=Steroidobacter cummioxidans TaxID=1803913 RepID=UPI0019D4CE4E|nr:alpha-L-arabinofuranosidase C-terminal domain-containing protein [Steroidobacter cummioxidans]